MAKIRLITGDTIADVKELDLVLKRQWYEMIEQGIKTEEYREIKPYWTKRFLRFERPLFAHRNGHESCNEKHYTHVRFRAGYTSRSMIFELKDIRIGKGRKEWGAPEGSVYILTLGNRCIEIGNGGQIKQQDYAIRNL